MKIEHNSIYSIDLEDRLTFSSLSKDLSCEIAIVGGGFTGLSAAISLAEKGYDVNLFEKEYIGFGCSGRNGGHLVQGWPSDFSKIQKSLPSSLHSIAWDAGMEAVDIVLSRIKKYKINCDLNMGYIHAALSNRQLKELITMKDEWEGRGYQKLKFLSNNDEIRKEVNTEIYLGGLLDKGSGHLQPMKYLQGLASAAKGLGVKIFEFTPITQISNEKFPELKTNKNFIIKAKTILLCGNAYLENISSREMRNKIAKVSTSVLATLPLEKKLAKELIPNNVAVADCNVALDYFRLDKKERMIFGGRSSYLNINPKDVKPILVKRMIRVFPNLHYAEIEKVWSGTVGITLNRIPHFGFIDKNILFVQGYSGHGVALTALAGKVMAEAINNETNRFEILSKIKHLNFPGGPFRTPVLALGMAWFKLKDWLKI